MSFQTEERLAERAEKAAENWAAVRRMGRFYFWALMLPFLFLIWAAGYGQGTFDSCLPARQTETVSKGVAQ